VGRAATCFGDDVSRGPTWSGEDLHKALSLRRLGVSYAEIGRQLGRSPVAVEDRLHKTRQAPDWGADIAACSAAFVAKGRELGVRFG
jgi:sigma-70-like protein